MRKFNIFSLIIIMAGLMAAQQNATSSEKMQWWREARFGLFIHWGVYAVPAGIYHGQDINKAGEWIMNRAKISVAEYRDFAKEFNPVKYDPEEWVRLAKEAGMKYIIITAKHHDGFALFHTSASSWNVVDATPYKQDLLKPLTAACRKYGMNLGFYYSQAQDWVNPGGAAARKIASEGYANPDSESIDLYTKEHNGHWDPLQTSKTMSDYIKNVSIPQVKELMTNYGDLAVLWWDTPTGMTDEFAGQLKELLKLQPNIITNDRLKRPNFPGDYKTPEQKIPSRNEMENSNWETCMTMNSTWGYKKNDHKWKSAETLIRNLVDIASKGGNYLLNVGPKADGTFPEESITRLKEIGVWMGKNSEAIYGTTASYLPQPSWGRITQKHSGNESLLYLSVFDWPKDKVIKLSGIKGILLSAQLLAENTDLKTEQNASDILIDLPETSPDKIAAVIKIRIRD
jgi:alpha-L-fucosidase